MTLLKRILSLLAVAVVIIGTAAPVSAQTANGTVAGFLTNGTTGGSSVANVEVTLQTYVNQTLTANLTTNTQNDGSFSFGNLDTQNTYRVAVMNFQEADYYGANFTFGPNETTESQNITVYDSTSDAGVINVDTAHVIISPGTGDLEFMVMCDFLNTSNRTYIGTGDPLANGKKQTLSFSIPTDATQVQYGDGLSAEYVYASHSGFIDTMAVLPGDRQVVYAYIVPFTGGSYNFQQKMNYPVALFNLLVDSTLKVQSSQLSNDGQPLDFGTGVTYNSYSGQNMAIGQTVAATLSGGSASSQMMIFIVIGLGIIVLAGGGFTFWKMRNRGTARPVLKTVPAVDNEQSLLLEIAGLDDDFAEGRIPEDVYKAKRAAKKASLVKLMNGKRG
jgi:hypothetical protein